MRNQEKVSLDQITKLFFIVCGIVLVVWIIYTANMNKVVAPDNVVDDMQLINDIVLENTLVEEVVDVSTIDYQILIEKDLSIPSAKRFDIRVLVNDNPVTEAEIKAISEKIVVDYTGKADAISILFYFDESEIEGAYTVAMVDWAPNGNWGDADLKSNQKFVYTFKDIVVKE